MKTPCENPRCGHVDDSEHPAGHIFPQPLADKPRALTKEQAIRMAASNWWVGMAPRDIAMFQLHESLLCMPFAAFQVAVEQALGRPVYTHEFGLNRDGLIRELLGEERAPTLDEIILLIPAEKRIVVWPDGKIEGVPQ